MTVDPYEAERRRSLEEYERKERRERVFRVSDFERERAIRQLRQHLAAGRIDMDEFTERMGLVYEARTNRDIEQALHELPFVTGDLGILASQNPPERLQGGAVDRFARGVRAGRGVERHAAAFAAITGAIFAVLALVGLVSGNGAFAALVALPMVAWSIWLLIHAVRELRDDR
jgi:hypothetical protein